MEVAVGVGVEFEFDVVDHLCEAAMTNHLELHSL